MIVLQIINLLQHLIQLPLPLSQKVNFLYIYDDMINYVNSHVIIIIIKENWSNWSRSMKSPKPMNGLQNGLKGNVDKNGKNNGLFRIFI